MCQIRNVCKCNSLQLRCVNKTAVSQSRSTREGAVWGSRWHCCSSNLLMRFRAVSQCLHIIWMSGCYFCKGLVVHLRVCGIFFIFYLSDSDWLQGVVSDTVVSSTTSKSISESSNSDRIWRPRGGVKLDFSKTFWVWWFKNTAISCKQNFMFAIKQTSQCQERKFIIFLDSLSALLVQGEQPPLSLTVHFFFFLSV